MTRNLQTYQNIWISNPPNRVTPGGQFLVRTTLYVDAPGKLLGLRFYDGVEENVNHVGVVVQRNTGTTSRAALGALAFPHYSPGGSPTLGWQSKYFNTPIDLVANDWIDAAVWFTGGSYWTSVDNVTQLGELVSGNIHVPKDGATDPGGNTLHNSAFGNTLTFNPNTQINDQLAGIDVIFLPN